MVCFQRGSYLGFIAIVFVLIFIVHTPRIVVHCDMHGCQWIKARGQPESRASRFCLESRDRQPPRDHVRFLSLDCEISVPYQAVIVMVSVVDSVPHLACLLCCEFGAWLDYSRRMLNPQS